MLARYLAQHRRPVRYAMTSAQMPMLNNFIRFMSAFEHTPHYAERHRGTLSQLLSPAEIQAHIEQLPFAGVGDIGMLHDMLVDAGGENHPYIQLLRSLLGGAQHMSDRPERLQGYASENLGSRPLAMRVRDRLGYLGQGVLHRPDQLLDMLGTSVGRGTGSRLASARERGLAGHPVGYLDMYHLLNQVVPPSPQDDDLRGPSGYRRAIQLDMQPILARIMNVIENT